MASVHTIASQSFLSPSRDKSKSMVPQAKPTPSRNFLGQGFSQNPVFSSTKGKDKNLVLMKSAVEEYDVIPVQSGDSTDQQEGMVVRQVEVEGGDGELATQATGFGANEGRFSFEGAGEFHGFSSSSASVGDGNAEEVVEMDKLIDRTINAAIVLAAGTFAITKLLTIDSDFWHVSQ